MNSNNADDDNGWIIKKVTRNAKEKRRYWIFGDAEEALLSVHEDIMIRFRLMKGQYVTESQMAEIMNEDERYKAYALAIAYLGAKPRTRKGIAQYLARKELQEDNIEYALNRLESEQLVDDEHYARQFAKSRLQNGLKGRLMIKQELQQRGIPQKTAAEALAGLDRDSELIAARALAAKKSSSMKGDLKQRKTKLTAFLMRRGFPGDIVREAIREVDWDTDEIGDTEDNGVLLDN